MSPTSHKPEVQKSNQPPQKTKASTTNVQPVSSGPEMGPDAGSFGVQADMLQRMPAGQQQAMLSRVGQVQGNQHVQRLVSSVGASSSGSVQRKKSPQEQVMERVHKYDTYIAEASKQFGIEENKIRAIIATESGGKPEASSGAAFGLMQVTKGTWEGTRTRFTELSTYEFSESNWKDPRINILMGTAVFKLKMKAVGIKSSDANSAELAVIAYNAGEGTVKHAMNFAKAGGSENPSADCLKPEYLKPAIKKTKIYKYYLTGRGKKNNPYVNGEKKYDETAAINHAVDMKFNEVSRYPKKVRQYLDVQKTEGSTSTEKPAEETKTEGGTKTISYTVKPGEGLDALSKKLGVSVEVIKAHNKDKLKKWGSVEGFNAGAVIEVPSTANSEKEEKKEANGTEDKGGFLESVMSGLGKIGDAVQSGLSKIGDFFSGLFGSKNESKEEEAKAPTTKSFEPTMDRVDMGKRKDHAAYMLDWDAQHKTINQDKTLREAFDAKLKIQLEKFFGKKITVAEVMQSIQAAESDGKADVVADLRAKLFKANQYAVVETLDVENSKRYEKKLNADGSTKSTYCNIYAYDVVSALGGYLPRVWWMDAALKKVKKGEEVTPKYGETIREMNANSLNSWMNSDGAAFGWKKADNETSAQNAANGGRLVILLAANANPRRSGHVSVVLSETDEHKAKRTGDDVSVPLQSQAGGTNYKYGGASAWWKNANHTNGAAWIFEGKPESPLITPEQVGYKAGEVPVSGSEATTDAPASVKTSEAETKKETAPDKEPKQEQKIVTYKVQPGEGLEVLSKKLGVSIEVLKSNNKDQLKQWKTSSGGVVEGFISGAVIKVQVNPTVEKEVEKSTNGSDAKGASKFGFWDSVKSGIEGAGKFVGDVVDKVGDFFGGLFGGSESETKPEAEEKGAWSLSGKEKKELDLLIANDRLTSEQIKRAREIIAKISDATVKGNFYESLQSKVVYANQRDNETVVGGKRKGDVMCNLTSLAMALQYLGIPNPDPTMQYEDSLEKIRQDKKLPARTLATGWGGVAKEVGASYHLLSSGGGAHDKKWYKDNVLSELRGGAAVMMSIQGHIVRLQNVTDAGLMVDDPFGKVDLKERKKTKKVKKWDKTEKKYKMVDKNYTGGWQETNKRYDGKGGAKENAGEDVTWPWSHVESYAMRWISTIKRAD